MAMQHGGDIQYGIKFNVDQTSLNAMKTSLQQISTLVQSSLNNVNTKGLTDTNGQLNKILETTKTIDTALESAFNVQLGTVDFVQFNQILKQSGVNLSQYQNQLARLGPAGQASFRNLATEMMVANMQIQRTTTALDKMKTTFANTIRWSISSSILMGFTSSVQKAFSYVKELDKSLNNIMLVTEKSSDQMAEFARQANKAAKELGQTTTAYTNASLIYYQQGLADAEVSARTETTLKAANVTKQSADAVSEQLTAVWNGYKVTAAETELYIDKLAKVAATTASDLEELSTGMSKVASAANIMGVDIDQLNGMLSTVISVTREAPESIGTSFKTIFARMSDIEAGLDTETTLGEYTQGMADLGFNVLDANGKIRDMGEVVEEIGNKWTDLTREQQLSLAQTMAGTRQYSRLLSLFDNWDMYTKAVNESANATGFLQQQQDEYMESMEAHLAQLKAASEGLYDSLFDTGSMNNLIDVFTGLIKFFDNGVQALGGGGNLLFLGLIGLLNIFSDKLAIIFTNSQMHLAQVRMQTANTVAQQEILNNLYVDNDVALERMIELKAQMLRYGNLVTAEEEAQGNAILKSINAEAEKINLLEKEKQELSEISQQMMGISLAEKDFSGESNLLGKNAFLSTQSAAKTMAKNGVNTSDLDTYINDMDATWTETRDVQASIRSLRAKKGGATRTFNSTVAGLDPSSETYAADVQNAKDIRDTSIKQFNAEIEAANKKLDELAQKRQTYSATYKEGVMGEQGLAQVYKEDAAAAEQAGAAVDKLTTALQTSDSQAENAKTAVANLNGTFKELGTKAVTNLGRLSKGLKGDLNNSIGSAQQRLDSFYKQAEQFHNALNTRAISQGFMTMVTSISTVTMSFSMLGNMITTLKNESLSAGEKILQVMQNIGFLLPMMISGISQFRKGWQQVSGALSIATNRVANDTAIQEMNNLAKSRGLVLSQNQTAQDNYASLQNKIYNQELAKQIALMEKKNGELTEELMLQAQEIAQKETSIAMGAIKTSQDKMEVTTSKAIAKNLWSQVAATMAKYWYIGLIIAAVAALAALYIKMEENSPEAQLKRAQESCDKANDSFEKLNGSINETKTAIDELGKSYTALEELETGTTAWYQEIAKVNTEISSLIEKYPELRKYATLSDGILKISDEGYQYLDEQMKKDYAASYNNTVGRTIDRNNAEIGVLTQWNNGENTFDDVIYDFDTGSTDEMWSLIQGLYSSDQFGENLFASEGITKDIAMTKLIEQRYGSLEELITDSGLSEDKIAEMQENIANEVDKNLSKGEQELQVRQEMWKQLYIKYSGDAEEYADDTWNDYEENIQGWLDENEERIKEINNLIQQNQLLLDQQMEQNFQALGSTRNIEQAKELTNEKGHDYFVEKGKEKAKELFYDKNWNEHKNYDEADLKTNKAYQDFVRLQGGDSKEVKYVAQRKGDMVLEIAGEEKKFSEEDFYNQLAEYYASDAYREEIGNSLKETLGEAVKNVEILDKLDTEELISLDNLHLQLKDALNQGADDKTADTIFSKIVGDIGTSKEALEDFSKDLQYIDWGDPESITKFNDAAKQLEDGKISVAEFNVELEKLNTLGRLGSDATLFSKAIANLELDEEESEDLKEYAQHLASISEESDLLADSLARDADSAADLAIEITQMNKGIEDLSEGIEEWADVLEKSSEESEEFSKALNKIKKPLANILDVTEDSLSDDFITKHLDQVKKAAEGDAEAIDFLRSQMDEEIIARVSIGKSDEIVAEIASLNDIIQNEIGKLETVEIGQILTAEHLGDDFLKNLNQMATDANMSAAEINDYLAGIGYEPLYSVTDVEGTQISPQSQTTVTVDSIDWDGGGTVEFFGQEMNLPSIKWTQNVEQLPGEELKSNTPLVSWSGGKEPAGPIQGIRRKATGSMSNNSSSNSGGKKSNNGGGGSKKKPQKVNKKLDPFKSINSQIKQTENDLVKLEKERERLSGGKLIQNLNKQLKNLEQQKKLQEEKLQIALEEERKLRQEIQQAGEDGYAFGIQFDAEGNITNYDQIAEQELAALKAATDRFNASAQSEADQEAYDKAKERYEKFEELIDEYYELHDNTINDIENQIQELYDQIIEMQVEKFTMDIELQTNFADIKNEWLELRDSILYSEKAFGQTAATAMSGLKDSMAGVYDTLADVEYMQGELAKIEAGQESELFGNNSKIANETINDTIETTQEWIEKSLDYIESIEEAAISAMEEIVDLQGQMIDSYDNLISALEHKISLKELLGGDGADTLDELNETFSIQLDIVKTAQQNLEANRKYLAENGEWLKENNPEEYLKYVNNVLEAEEKVFSSVEEAITTLNDLFDKGIENMLKEVETAYAGALGWEELSTRWENDQELADLYLTSVQKEYELQKMLNKVNQDILDKQYDSIYAQQKLNDFKENYIKMLEKEGDLTQAQVDRMNKMYELTLLQIALEEAKNNKSSMKLTRDSQGNYVYQYTTDEAEVAKREQELADKKNEIYKQDIEDTKSAISDYISAGKDAQSEYMDLFESEEFKRYMELSAESVGRELTPEEQAELDTAREKAYDMLAERAQTSAKQMEAQRKSTLEGINNILKDVDLQEIDWTQDYDTIVDNLDENQLDALLDAGIDLRSSAFKSLFGFNSNTYLQDILSSENGVWNGYLNAVGSYGNNLEQVLQAVGSENLDSYYNNIDLIYQEVQTIQNEISTQAEMANKEYQLTQNTLKEAERIRKELEKDFSENGRLNDIMNTQLATLEDELLEVKKELKKQTRLLDPNSEDDSEDVVTGWINNNGIWSYADSSGKSVKGWNKLDWQGKQDWYMFDENGIMKTNEWIHNASGTWSYVNGAGQAVTGWQVLDWQGKNDWYHFDEEGTMSANKWIGDYFVGSGGQMLTNTWVGHNGMYYWVGSDGKWLDLPSWTSHGRPNDGYPIYEYDTGGYTGSWFNGSRDGRLAFLHQKELVLNEKDTPRILDAVKLVREISTGSIIKGFEAQMRNTLSSLENQLIGTYANIEGMAAAAKQSTDQMLEQAVHIDASFPGVRDAREIEEALNNLVNVASQYAYENNK